MEVLGANYGFKTRFYLDGGRVLYIRGGGDPFLISEELAQLAPALVGEHREMWGNTVPHSQSSRWNSG